MAKRQMRVGGRTPEQTAVYYIGEMGGAEAIKLFREHLATCQRRVDTVRVEEIRKEYVRLLPWYKAVLAAMGDGNAR